MLFFLILKGRLAGAQPKLKEALWDMFDTNTMGQHLAAQFLIAPDGSKPYVMEHKNMKLKLKHTPFSKACLIAKTFEALKPNCW